MYEVVYLPTARRQLEDIVDYIALELGAPQAALDFLDELDAAVKGLSDMPYRNPVYHTDFAVLDEIRWTPVKNYSVFYKVYEAEKTVEIRRVLHRLQDKEKRNKI